MLSDFNSYFIGCHEIALGDDAGAKEVQVLKVGKYQHPLYGAFEITSKVLKKFKENFDRNVRKIDLVFNYEHGESKAHGTKAAGWIKNLSIKNDGKELWATPDWTQSGLQHIKEKEYRYTSAEFLPKYKDAETGKVFDWVLIGAALTNKPFVKGMNAIAASELHQDKQERVKPMKLAELKVELSEHGIDLSELQKKAERHDALEAEKVELSEKLETVTTKNKELEGKVTALSEKVDTIEKEKAEIKFNELKKKGMEEGKLTKAMADGTFKTMFEKNGAEFCEAYLSEAPKVVPVGETKGSDHNEGEKTKAKPASVQVTELAEKMAEEKKISFADASMMVLSENPKLAEAYEKEALA